MNSYFNGDKIPLSNILLSIVSRYSLWNELRRVLLEYLISWPVTDYSCRYSPLSPYPSHSLPLVFFLSLSLSLCLSIPFVFCQPSISFLHFCPLYLSSVYLLCFPLLFLFSIVLIRMLGRSSRPAHISIASVHSS